MLNHLEFLSLKGGCTGLSESIYVKMTNCWKSQVTTHFSFFQDKTELLTCLEQEVYCCLCLDCQQYTDPEIDLLLNYHTVIQ